MTLPRFDWKNRVDSAVEAAESVRPMNYGQPKIKLSFRSPAVELIKAAAASRGVTMSGFIRRAALAMAAQVLGIPYQQAVDVDPTIQLAVGSAPVPDPSGQLAGPWEITALR